MKHSNKDFNFILKKPSWLLTHPSDLCLWKIDNKENPTFYFMFFIIWVL